MSRLDNKEDNKHKSAKKRLRWWLIPLSFLIGLLFSATGIFFYLTATNHGKQFVTHIGNKLLNDYLTENAVIGNIEFQLPPRLLLSDITIYDHKDSILFRAEGLRVTPIWPPVQDSVLLLDQVVITHFTGNLKHYEKDDDFNYKYAFKIKGQKANPTTSPIKSVSIRKSIFEEGNFNLSDYTQKPHVKKGEKAVDFYRIKTSSINGVLDSVSVENGFNAILNHFSARDISGFVIKDLTARLQISKQSFSWHKLNLATNQGKLVGDVDFEFESWADWKYFNDKVQINAHLNPSQVYAADLAYFAPEVKDLVQNVGIEGNIEGCLNSFKGSDFKVNLGKSSYVSSAFSITGLPNIDSAYFNARIFDSRILLSDINKKMAKVSLPQELYRLGDLDFEGDFIGYINDFKTNGTLISNLGTAEADLKVELYDLASNNHYEGNLNLTDFDIGALLDEKSIGKVSLSSTLNAKGNQRENIRAKLISEVVHFEFENYDYKNVAINGEVANNFFKGELISNDPNADLDLTGLIDYSKVKPYLDLTTNIKNLNLQKLNLTKDTIQIQSLVEMKFSGDKIENFIGDITTKNLFLNVNGINYETGFTKVKGVLSEKGKMWTLTSDFVEAELETSLPIKGLANSILAHGLDLLPKDLGQNKQELNDYLKAYVLIKEPSILNSLLPKDLVLAPFSQVDITINDEIGRLDLDLNADYFGVANMHFERPKVRVKKLGDSLVSNLTFNSLTIDSLSINDYALNLSNDSLKMYLQHSGYINDTLLSFNLNNSISYSNTSNSTLTLDSSNIIFGADSFLLATDTLVWQNKNEFVFDDLRLEYKNEKIQANGFLNLPNDYDLHYSIFDINLKKISPFLPEYFQVLEGSISGNGSVASVNGYPLFEASLYANPISFREMDLEAIEIESHYASDTRKLGLNVILKATEGYDVLRAGGTINYEKAPEAQLKLSMLKVPNKLFEGLANGVVSNLNGLVSADINFNGKLTEPKLSGWFALDSSSLHVDYLGVDYSLNDTIKIDNNKMYIKHLVLEDIKGNKGILNGHIRHDLLSKFDLNLDMKCRNFNMLKTKEQDNDLYYGEFYGTGTGKFTGPLLRAHIACDVETEKGTKFFLPIEEEQGYSQESYIRFVNIEESLDEYKVNDQDFSLDLSITMNTKAETQLIFDKQLGDIIKASGNGKINMQLSPAGELQMFGNYEIDNGNYLFTAFDLINKKFEVEKGSKIIWTGDPYDAQIDIKATYLLKTNAYNLASSIPSYDQNRLEQYKKPVDVAANANLTGSLLKPEIKLDFAFIADGITDVASLERDLNNLDLSEEELTKQVVSLLVLNRFMPIYTTASTSESLFSSGVSTALGDLITNQVSYWLSSVSDDVQVNLDYRENQFTDLSSASSLSQSELELALSTTLFNDRVIVDFAYEFQNGYSPNKQIAYKLNPDGTARVLAFQRQKVNPLSSNNINRFGFGVFLKKEFNSLEELFKKKDNAKK